MKINKKFVKSLLLILALVFALVGCSQNESDNVNETTEQVQEENSEAEVSEETEAETSEEVEASEETEDSESQANGEALSFTDATGREVSIEGPIESLVVIYPSDAEILSAIGAKDLIVGRGEYVNYPEELLDLPNVGSGQSLNLEEIVALDPDVVVFDILNHSEDQLKSLEDAGLTVVTTAPTATSESIEENITFLGKLTGHEDEALSLVEEIKSTFDEYGQKADEINESHTVYFEISPLEYGLWTGGSGTYFDLFTETLNLENIFADTESWAEISEEEVIARNPEYIITTTTYISDDVSPEEEIMAREGWEDVDAVKNANVYAVDSDIFGRTGPRLMEAVEILYGHIYE